MRLPCICACRVTSLLTRCNNPITCLLCSCWLLSLRGRREKASCAQALLCHRQGLCGVLEAGCTGADGCRALRVRRPGCGCQRLLRRHAARPPGELPSTPDARAQAQGRGRCNAWCWRMGRRTCCGPVGAAHGRGRHRVRVCGVAHGGSAAAQYTPGRRPSVLPAARPCSAMGGRRSLPWPRALPERVSRGVLWRNIESKLFLHMVCVST